MITGGINVNSDSCGAGDPDGDRRRGRDRKGQMSMTADGIDHGKSKLEDCLWATVERFEDGYVLCPILWSGGSCEECSESMERWWEREDK